MTTRTLHALQRPLHQRSRLGGIQVRILAVIVFIAVTAGTVVSTGNPTFARFIVAASAGAVFAVLASSSPRTALGSVLVWLVVLGFIRRLLIPFLGWSTNDPLLLVGPGCALILLALTPRERVPRRDSLTPFVVVLLLWCLAEVMNPAQGGPSVGVRGLLIYLGPLLWFFVGKRLSDEEHRFVRRVILWSMAAVLASGLYQSFIGFFPFELHWIGVSGFGASIFIDNFKIRPFSTLASPQEYGAVLGIAMAIVWPRVLGGPFRKRWLGFFLLLVAALVLQSSRGLVVFAALMVLITTMLWYRSLGVTIFLLALAGLVIAMGSNHDGTVNIGNGQPWASFVNHTINGLLSPDQSTLPLHQSMVSTALKSAVDEPLGLGVGHGTIAEVRAGKENASAENDFGTTAIALGILAAVLFELLVLYSMFLAGRRFWRTRSPMDLATLGIQIVCLTQWWAVSMYTATALLWLSLGALTAAEARDREARTTNDSRPLILVPAAN